MIRPPEDEAASRADGPEAGLPIRIAEATVSGSDTGAPSTSGAAPAAWKPNNRGVPATTSSPAYSR